MLFVIQEIPKFMCSNPTCFYLSVSHRFCLILNFICLNLKVYLALSFPFVGFLEKQIVDINPRITILNCICYDTIFKMLFVRMCFKTEYYLLSSPNVLMFSALFLFCRIPQKSDIIPRIFCFNPT